jgi:hypothetical protein
MEMAVAAVAVTVIRAVAEAIRPLRFEWILIINIFI